MKDKAQVKELIAEGKIKEALKELAVLSTDTALYNDVIQLQSKFSRFQREKESGAMDSRDVDTKEAKITKASVALTDRLDEKDSPPLQELFDSETNDSPVEKPEKSQTVIHQTHHGKGDNVGGDKIIYK